MGLQSVARKVSVGQSRVASVCFLFFTRLARELSRVPSEQKRERLLETQDQNWHRFTSILFYWPKQDIRSTQIQGQPRFHLMMGEAVESHCQGHEYKDGTSCSDSLCINCCGRKIDLIKIWYLFNLCLSMLTVYDSVLQKLRSKRQGLVHPASVQHNVWHILSAHSKHLASMTTHHMINVSGWHCLFSKKHY